MKKHLLTLPMLAIMVAACGGKDETTSGQEWTTDPACEVGARGCPCTSGGACDDSLTCLEGRCVAQESPAPCCQETPHDNIDFSPGLLPEHAAERGSAGAGAVGESTSYGAPIGEVCGVVAYQNGPVVDHYSGRGSYGLEYQCTEFAFRFLAQAYGLADSYDPATQGAYRDARYWFDQSYNSVINSLERYPNGSQTPPKPGDILVWDYGAYGHVAVIKDVDFEAGWVVIAEQNNFQGNKFVPLERKADGRYVGQQSLKGWLRAPGAWEAHCAPDPAASCTGILHHATITSESLLTVRADVHCDGGLEQTSLVVGEGAVVHSQSGSGESLHIDAQIDLADTNAPEGTQSLGLWAQEVGQEARLVASKTISWSKPCDEAPHRVCMGDRDIYTLQCDARRFVRTCGQGEQCRMGDCEDAPVTCQNECTQGLTRCDGEASVERCEMTSAGCTAWRHRETCSGASTCEVSRGVATCKCASGAELGCHNGDVWSFDACGVRESRWESCRSDERCVEDGSSARCELDAPSTSLEANANSPSYTAGGPCDTANSRALYKGSAVTIDEASATATLAFQKCDGSSNSSSRHYWIVVGDAYPVEHNVPNYHSRKQGRFYDPDVTLKSNREIIEISDVSIWPSASAYQAAPCGEEKHISLITDGSTTPGARTWYAYQSITFEKTCN